MALVGCSGGIFHDLYCVWGGADKFIPIDVYIPGCPPTPAATIYGFAIGLGLLGQKLKTSHHVQGEDEHVSLAHPQIPYLLRVQIERESRRMAGYLYGKQIAGLPDDRGTESKQVKENVQAYLDKQADPRLAEIVTQLATVYDGYQGAA